jgi:hypothetical protein
MAYLTLLSGECYLSSPVYVGDEISWSAIIGTVHPKVN